MATIPGTGRLAALATTPTAPPPGYVILYFKTDNTLYIQDSNGVETPIGTASGITSLTGDVTGTGPGAAVTTVQTVGGATAAQIASAVSAYLSATSSSTPNTLVQRDASGNFIANIITASLTGSASLNVLKSGDTMTGPLNINSAAANALIVDTDVLVVDAALNRVGINKVNPTEALEVVGNIKASGTITGSNISGTNTGDVTVTDSSNIDLTLTGQNLTADLINTGVTPGSYGSATQTSAITVDAKGRLSSATSTSIAIPSTQVTDFTEAAQDAVGGMFTDTDTVDLTYNDGSNTVSADVKISDATITSDINGIKVGTVQNANLASGIDALKIGSGLVSNTEYGYLDGVTSNIQAQLDSKTLALPTNSEIVYVEKSGNDGTADGTLFKPYLTVSAAMASITDASTNKRYIIKLGPGTYAESTLQLKPWVWIVGNGRSSTRINVTTAPNLVTLHPDWGTATSRGGMINVYGTGSTGFNGDLVALGGGTSAVFEFQDTFFNGNVTFKGRSTADFVEYLRGYIFGTTTLSSIQGFFFQIVQSGPLVIDTAGTADNGAQILGCLVSGATSINQTSTYSCSPQFIASSIQNTITATRSGSAALSISADVSSIPVDSQISLSGGATLSYLSDSKHLKYIPTSVSNWTFAGSTPGEVQTALDAIVANISNVNIASHASRHLPSGVDALATASAVSLDANSTNTIGTNDSFARSDHTHDLSTGVVSTQIPDQANAEGTSANLSRADHVHNIPSATPVQIGTSNFAGAAASFALSDHVHNHGNQTNPAQHAVATVSANGFMSSSDKSKLDASTNLNTASAIVQRDASGNFSAGTITANLSGNATNFTGSLIGDVTGTQSATVVSQVAGKTAAQVSTSVDDTLAATSTNTASTIVKRDASGNFNASQVSQSIAQLRGTTQNLNISANPSSTYSLVMPSTQGQVGTYLTNDGTGTLSWSSPIINIDGGRPDTIFVVGANINGGTP